MDIHFIVVHCFVNDENSLALTRLGLSIGECAMKKRKKNLCIEMTWQGQSGSLAFTEDHS